LNKPKHQKENLMNTSTLVRSTNIIWLRRGIAVAGALLIGGTIALSLGDQLRSEVVPATAPVSVNAGRERFAAMKERQANARDMTFASAPAQDTGRERFAAMKERQAELRDAIFVPATVWSSAMERFAALKQWVAEQIMDAAMGNVPVSTRLASNERFLALKQRQVEAYDATFVPASTVSSAMERFAALKAQQVEQTMDAAMGNVIAPAAPVANERFAALKQRQADLRDATFVPAPPAPSSRERFADLKQRQAELREGGR
jgi:hypothetical protein